MFVTLFVYAVRGTDVRAHEYAGDACLYLGDVTIPRARLPRVRPGQRVRLKVA
ncbi:MAG TPA: hypothetical protein VE777_20515 [Gaiellales bacterium]|nr:hypothetical protein [Gaiellales bacterium]